MNTFNQQAQILKTKHTKKVIFKKKKVVPFKDTATYTLSPQNNTGHHVFSALGQIPPSLQRCLSLDDKKLGILQLP